MKNDTSKKPNAYIHSGNILFNNYFLESATGNQKERFYNSIIKNGLCNKVTGVRV